MSVESVRWCCTDSPIAVLPRGLVGFVLDYQKKLQNPFLVCDTGLQLCSEVLFFTTLGRKNTIFTGYFELDHLFHPYCELGGPSQHRGPSYKVVQSENDVGGWRRAPVTGSSTPNFH